MSKEWVVPVRGEKGFKEADADTLVQPVSGLKGYDHLNEWHKQAVALAWELWREPEKLREKLMAGILEFVVKEDDVPVRGFAVSRARQATAKVGLSWLLQAPSEWDGNQRRELRELMLQGADEMALEKWLGQDEYRWLRAAILQEWRERAK